MASEVSRAAVGPAFANERGGRTGIRRPGGVRFFPLASLGRPGFEPRSALRSVPWFESRRWLPLLTSVRSRKPRAGFEPAESGSAGRRVRPDSATLAPLRRTALSRINPAVCSVVTTERNTKSPEQRCGCSRLGKYEWQAANRISQRLAHSSTDRNAGGLIFRVRDGYGSGPAAMAALIPTNGIEPLLPAEPGHQYRRTTSVCKCNPVNAWTRPRVW